jgi:hypothetical protein
MVRIPPWVSADFKHMFELLQSDEDLAENQYDTNTSKLPFLALGLQLTKYYRRTRRRHGRGRVRNTLADRTGSRG